VDAYLLTHRLLENLTEMGNRIYDHTECTAVTYDKSGVQVRTGSGHTIRAQKLVVACGYESQSWLQQKCETLYTTYALVSEPDPDTVPWPEDYLLWETASPYCYLRRTDDGRILIGGKDTLYDKSFKLLPRKVKALERSFAKLFPGTPLRTDISWAGIFGQTKDGLPYIGAVKGQPHTYYALGYGGNGITFSVIAAGIVAGLIRNGHHPDAGLFAFNR
jgi:glycine/D-amino acid oxidase-like deaminating enzyme